MSDTIKPPSPELLALCDHSDQLIEAYLKALPPKISGRYESEVEYYSLLKLILRHLESIIVLARSDVVLAPSALLISRTIFETSVRARWMFVPIDPFEREVRWLLFLRTGTTQAEKLVNSKDAPEALVSMYDSKRESYTIFAEDISKLLVEKGYSIPKQAPNVWIMLEELGEKELYRFYVMLSAYTHSNFEAATLYKKHLGESKECGEFTSESDWLLPFSVAWKTFYKTAHVFLSLIDADIATFEKDADPLGFQAQWEELLKTVYDAG